MNPVQRAFRSVFAKAGAEADRPAKDDDGSTQISITLVVVSDKKVLLMTGWGTEVAQKENLEELTAIMNSIKVVQ